MRKESESQIKQKVFLQGPIWLMLIICLFQSCQKSTLFELKSATDTGVDFRHKLTSHPNQNILNYIYFYNGGGVGIADFNNDSLPDLIFTTNQNQASLYLNKGEMTFEKSDLPPLPNGWTNGVALADVNADGNMDFYLSRVASDTVPQVHNALMINQGVDDNGVPSFKEQSQSYGLDFRGLSTQSAFFDYDLDGDLDLYLMNHSINPNLNYGSGNKRKAVDSLSGDRLYENQNGKFVDVSASKGIFQGAIGYGLGLSVADFNNDGYPDLYIGNDFFENDYLYINQDGKYFEEIIHTQTEALGHTTHYSMGNDSGDLNNDGLMDIISVDMLPEDLVTYKSSGTEFNFQLYNQYVKNGYAHQYMQNTLHLNRGNEVFSEIGNAAGISATEWSWSPLIADFDLDGYSDLFVSNGIMGATNDMDYINFIANDEIQKQLGRDMKRGAMAFIEQIPVKKTANYLFKNTDGQTLIDLSEQWMPNIPSFSHGAAYADLDLDGDLDLVVNNTMDPSFIMENKARQRHPDQHYLSVLLRDESPNKNAIGARVTAHHKNRQLTRENHTTRGFLSSSPPVLHFGLGDIHQLDSLVILWPTGQRQVLSDVETNRRLVVERQNDGLLSINRPDGPTKKPLMQALTPSIDWIHQERSSLDFNRNPLTPYAHSNEGPAMTVGDLNGDQREDLIITGAKGQNTAIFYQNPDGTLSHSALEDSVDALSEGTAVAILDANNDGLNDLIIGHGGNEFKTGEALKPRLYLNTGHGLVYDPTALPDFVQSTDKITVIDLNQDGLLDLILTAKAVSQEFGVDPMHYLLRNEGNGRFSDHTKLWGEAFSQSGPISDLVWTDFNGDGLLDAVSCGPWNTPTLWLHNDAGLQRASNTNLNQEYGLWESLAVADFDRDGDYDIAAGNWGTNLRWAASNKDPMRLYRYDFDQNQSEETVVTYVAQNRETTVASKDELVKQLPMLNKKYLSYERFGRASLSELFGSRALEAGLIKQVTELSSCYFENTGNNRFKKHLLPQDIQYSSVRDLQAVDLNQDGFMDLLPCGNDFEISTQLGRLDAFKGGALINHGGVFKFKQITDEPWLGAGRAWISLPRNSDTLWIMARNNNSPLVFKK